MSSVNALSRLQDKLDAMTPGVYETKGSSILVEQMFKDEPQIHICDVHGQLQDSTSRIADAEGFVALRNAAQTLLDIAREASVNPGSVRMYYLLDRLT